MRQIKTRIKKPSLLALVGPTASGKTEWGLHLARERDGEIISVDSRQVYRELAIGTAKPAGIWQAGTYRVEGIAYNLVDIWDPAQPFTAGDFIRLAREAIEETRRRGKLPILVGGTGLYLKALSEGIAELPEADPGVRAELRALADAKGRAHLHQELQRVDPAAAGRIPPNNIHRVMRALEVYRLTGKPITHWHQQHQAKVKKKPAESIEILGIERSREDLHRRIEQRCGEMVERGLVEETRSLLEKGVSPKAPALTGLGYPRVIEYIAGAISRTELLEQLIRDTRHYAKRQLTWFRHQAEVKWKKL